MTLESVTVYSDIQLRGNSKLKKKVNLRQFYLILTQTVSWPLINSYFLDKQPADLILLKARQGTGAFRYKIFDCMFSSSHHEHPV